ASCGGSYLIERDGLARVETEFEQPAERHAAMRLLVDDLGVFAIGRVRVCACRMLQLGDRVGGPSVVLAAHAPCIFATCVQHILEDGIVLVERVAVDANGFFGNLEETNTLDARGCAGEVSLD